MTTNLFFIANVKQLRTGGNFRILLPFFSEHLGVLASKIQQFLTVFTIWLSLARFWRTFGISGGGLNPPGTPLFYAILISSWYADTAVVTQFSGERLCSETFFLFLYMVMYNAWNWWRKWSSEASFNVITQQKFWSGMLFPSITIVCCLSWPADSGCVGQERPYSEPEWSLTCVQKPNSRNYAQTVQSSPVQSNTWHWIFVYNVTRFCSWVAILKPLAFTFGFCPKD